MPLEEQELAARAAQRQFYTVLLADDSPVTAPEGLAGALRGLRRDTDEVQYEVLVVSSIEDAITAVALNGEIQAAIVRHDVPLRSREHLPIMTRLLGVRRSRSPPTGQATGRSAGRGSASCGPGSTCTC